MMRQILVAAVLVVGVMTLEANAGVRGGHFTGTLLYTDGTTTDYASTDFASSGNGFLETYNYESGTESYPGTYVEIDLYLVSFWVARYQDYPKYEISGISLLGLVTTYNVEQTDGDDDYSGIVYRTGTSAIRK